MLPYEFIQRQVSPSALKGDIDKNFAKCCQILMSRFWDIVVSFSELKQQRRQRQWKHH